MRVVRLCLLVHLLWLGARCGGAQAETRRAVIVGINRYAVNAATDRTQDLDGAVNDAQAMVETLTAFHRFQRADIRLLLDQDATRAAILGAIKEHLTEAAQPGDVSLLFFAGHGSYRESVTTREVDHQDETIVPADTNRGAADIVDKELAQLFNRALDRQLHLVALFDSCHSGSVARGFAGDGKTRFAPPAVAAGNALVSANTGAADPREPQQRGAIILAAAQDQQTAQERFVRGQPRGRFSSALQQALITAAPDETVDHLYLRLRALMQAGGSAQEPVLATTPERRAQSIWGGRVSSSDGPPRVAVGRVTASVVYLDAGYAMGLGPNAILRRVGSDGVQLQISEVLGPGSSKATVSEGRIGRVKSGDLFAVDNFGAPYLEPLRVYVPADPPTQEQLVEVVTLLAPLRSQRGVSWVTDPTETTPTHTMLWRAGQWFLRDRQHNATALGTRPTLKQIRQALPKLGSADVHFFLGLPLPSEQVAQLAIGRENGDKSVVWELESARADYLLVGRVAAGKPEYALLMPDADQSTRTVVPVRTTWLAVDGAAFREIVYEDALRLARIKTWQSVESPRSLHPFPYQLRLRSEATRRYLAPGEPVHGGENYTPVLAIEPSSEVVPARYVYLFSIDSNGRTVLFVPGDGIAIGENLFPNNRGGSQPLTDIQLGAPITIGPPYGTDTLVLLTSASALPQPSVLVIEPAKRGRRPVKRRCTHPLECLIFGINDEDTRSRSDAPADWSVQRLVVRSLER